MGRDRWGSTVGALVLTVTVAATSGCGGSDDAVDAKPTAAVTPKPVSLTKATTEFQDAVTDYDAQGGCVSIEPNTCYDAMIDLIEPARDLRKAMNSEKSVAAEFWTEAYALINIMEKGVEVGEDRGGGLNNTASNRPDVFGSAHDLADWLDQNPVS
ncbi:hypothetical protein ACFU96_21190 [Streptomyces sp. NPDC057620]|uniref:hypothetical protein n=1 Tax=Streptomyces sp. NPDC057620 TaxID=3346185 RepID=UPI0036A86F44